MKTLIIIPAFNEARCIGNTINDIPQMDFFKQGFDILVVSDGSTDGTADIARATGVFVMELPYNMGIGSTVQTGYKFALTRGYDFAFQFDADGQHPAEYIESMLQKLIAEKASLIIGSRFLEKEGFQSTRARQLGIRIFQILIKLLTGKRITDATAGFRIVDREGIKLLAKYYPEDYAEPETVIFFHRCGMKIVEFPVIMKARQGGESSINLFLSLYYMIKVPLAMLVGFFRTKRMYISKH